MQKKLIALAVATLVSGGAFAADNVTVYGRVDYGFLNTSGNSGGVQGAESKNEFTSGVQAGSRLGFKGSEDLGNGLKAIFELEYGLGVDGNNANSVPGVTPTILTKTPNVNGSSGVASQQTTFWNRHSYVGLTGNFGTVVGGRLDGVRYGVFNKYDVFGGGTVGNFTQLTTQVNRADNAIAYISPSFSGFTVLAALSTNIAGPESAGNHNDLRLATLMGSYANGPISVDLDWERVSDNKTTVTTGANGASSVAGAPLVFDNITVTTLGGSYDFGMVKVAALYDTNKLKLQGGATASDVQSWFVSGSMPFAGSFLAKATYGQTKDKNVAQSTAKKFGLGLDYNLSKRTTIYTDYGKITQDSNAAYRINVSGWGNGSGVGTNGFDLGIAHKF